eukprot:CAMPEP_0178990930 /NCGR_PEP_ID=MMETSP0795-20121207/5238_1 /TAXON_ID=88552 /ORGANISM="Amoebophrya sp., Strain Ameob2" /LENGTH=370 /DNA_ID=CAMNT_0020682567 /DNA_START=324 /DNA_END=1437 /DNA_ORIENTATION=+
MEAQVLHEENVSYPSRYAPEVDVERFIESERRFVQYQQAGEHEKAVHALESVLRQNKDFVQNLESTLLSSLFEKLAVGYNTLGMKFLKLGKTDLSLRYFQKSEVVTDPANLHIHQNTRLVLRAVTYNNLGCFYKSMNKLHTALHYLRKALVIEEKALDRAYRDDEEEQEEEGDARGYEQSGGSCGTSSKNSTSNPAATHLNLCALLSQMSMHEKALYHAQKALHFLPPVGEGSSSRTQGSSDPEKATKQQDESLTPVAYFNMGAEYEHLKYYVEALDAYEQAYEACLSELGSAHALTSKIAASVKQLKKKLGPRADEGGKTSKTVGGAAGKGGGKKKEQSGGGAMAGLKVEVCCGAGEEPGKDQDPIDSD